MVRAPWTRQQLLVAFWLYCRLPFGRLHYRNPQIVELAKAIDRTPSALAMKLVNIASLDPAITNTGRSGLSAASAKDREMWAEMQQDWEKFAVEANRAVEAVQSDHASDLQPQTQASQEPTLQGRSGRRAAHDHPRAHRPEFLSRRPVERVSRPLLHHWPSDTGALDCQPHRAVAHRPRQPRESPQRLAAVRAARQSVRQRLDYDCRGHDGACGI